MTKTNISVAIAAVVIILAVGIAFAFANSATSETESQAQLNLETTSSVSTASTVSSATSSSNTAITTSEETQTATGTYTDYTSSALTEAQQEGDNIVIFFAASWCPSCRGHDESLQSSRSEIPGDVTILKADYDSEISLRQKYGVTTQHTFVQIDADGEQLKKWNALYGENSLESVLSELV